jgi:DNA-binding transcriptional regulator YdaS (Cro superfamily)
MEKSHVIALRRAIEVAGGTQAKLAARMRKVGHRTVTQQTISHWLANETLLEAVWWPFIEKATNNAVTRYHLRPDLFADVRCA